jgi:hypothetical protein
LEKEDMNNLSRSIMSIGIETIIKSLRRTQDWLNSLPNSIINQCFSNHSRKEKEGRTNRKRRKNTKLML